MKLKDRVAIEMKRAIVAIDDRCCPILGSGLANENNSWQPLRFSVRSGGCKSNQDTDNLDG